METTILVYADWILPWQWKWQIISGSGQPVPNQSSRKCVTVSATGQTKPNCWASTGRNKSGWHKPSASDACQSLQGSGFPPSVARKNSCEVRTSVLESPGAAPCCPTSGQGSIQLRRNTASRSETLAFPPKIPPLSSSRTKQGRVAAYNKPRSANDTTESPTTK